MRRVEAFPHQERMRSKKDVRLGNSVRANNRASRRWGIRSQCLSGVIRESFRARLLGVPHALLVQSTTTSARYSRQIARRAAQLMLLSINFTNRLVVIFFCAAAQLRHAYHLFLHFVIFDVRTTDWPCPLPALLFDAGGATLEDPALEATRLKLTQLCSR